jgi:hypothetical protein
MEEIDLYRTAAEMIKRHGDDASLQAAMKSDALLEKGDIQGAKVWRGVVKKIGILLVQAAEGQTRH